MFKFLKPAPEAQVKVPKERIIRSFKIWQLRILSSTSLVYVGYYIIRLIFTAQQNEIRQAYNFSLSQIGFILSMFGIGYGLSKLVMGSLADRLHPNCYVVMGLIISSIINFILGSTHHYYFILFLMFLNSFMQGIGAAACQRLVSLWFGQKGQGCLLRRGTAFAIWSSAHNFGAFACIATVNLSGLIFGQSLQYSFYTASIVSIIIALITLGLGGDRPTSKGLPTIEEYSADQVAISKRKNVGNEDITELSILTVFVEYILRNRLVWAIIFISLLIYIVRYGVMSWIPAYLPEHKGFSVSEAKWLMGIFEFSAIPGVIILGLVSDTLKGNRALVLIFSLFGMMVSLTVYSFASDHIVILVTLLVLGTLIYAPATLVGLMVNEAVPKFALGMSTGVMGVAQYLIGEVIAVSLIPIFVERYGWGTSNVILFGAAFSAFLLSIYILKCQGNNK